MVAIEDSSAYPDISQFDLFPGFKMIGVKNDQGKLRFDLLPVRPLEKVVEVYSMGAKKYADRNWEKGLQWSRVFAAMMRHAWAWWRREQKDQIDGQHHLASVVFCALALMEYEQTHPELDDRVRYDETKIINEPQDRTDWKLTDYLGEYYRWERSLGISRGEGVGEEFKFPTEPNRSDE